MRKFAILCTAATVGLAGVVAPAQAQRMVTEPYYVPRAKMGAEAQKKASEALKAMDEAVDEALKAVMECKPQAYRDAKAKLDAAMKKLKENTEATPKVDAFGDPAGIDAYVDEIKAGLEQAAKTGKGPREIPESERIDRAFPSADTDLGIVLARIARLRFLVSKWITKEGAVIGPCPKDTWDEATLKRGKQRTAAERAKKKTRPETKSEREAREQREKRKKGVDELPAPGEIQPPPLGEGG